MSAPVMTVEDVLKKLLVAWRKSRDPELAVAIDRVAQRIDLTRERPTGKSVKERETRWLALDDRGDPADLGVLLSTLLDLTKAALLEARIERLAGRPRDPRIAMRLATMTESWPIPGATGVTSLERALDVIVTIADPRTLPVLEAIDVRVSPSGSHRTTWFLRQHLGRYLAALGKRVTTSKAHPQRAALIRLVGDDAPAPRATAASQPDLLAAVYRDVDDDAPRLVLADFLQERGDPRGELIALQMARAGGAGGPVRKREAELLRAHAREWLGPIEPAVQKSGLAFERGFLARCAVRDPGATTGERILACIEWATVVEVDVGGWQAFAFGAAERMPALRAIRGLDSFIPWHPRLEEASLKVLWSRAFDHVVKTDAPALRRLTIEKGYFVLADLARLLGAPIGQALDELTLDNHHAEEWIGALLAQLAPQGPLRVAAILSRGSWPWRLRFEGDTVTAEHIWRHAEPHEHADDLTQQLDWVDRRRVPRARLAAGIEPTPELQAALAAFGTRR